MDQSIEELLAGLQAAQEQKSTVKLSERNIVELVNKLRARGLLDDVGLLHTINGKEYITRDRVKSEVKAAVARAGGRIELADLPPLVGVDLVHCEVAARAICAESQGETHLLQGEIITTQYFDNLALEVDGELQESGVVALADLARRHHLSSELVVSNVSARLGAIISGRMEGGLLYTQAYVARVKARLRGALRGCMAPTLIPELLARMGREMGAEGGDADPKLIASVVEELLKDGEVAGVMRGGGTSWVPDVYAAAQAHAARSFYDQNAYLDYEHAGKMGLNGGRAELAGMLPDGVPLHGAIVAPQLLLQLEASVDEALSSGSWLDVQTLLPSVLSVEDAGALLARCGAVKSAAADSKSGIKVLAGTCVFSGVFLKEAAVRCAEAARDAARQTALERRSLAGKASASATAADPVRGGGKGKGEKGLGNVVEGSRDSPNDGDDDWGMGPKKGKKGKGGGKKGGSKTTATGELRGGKGAERQQKEAPTRLRAPTVEKIADQLVEWYPDLHEPAGECDMLAQEVAGELLSHALLEYEAELSAASTVGSDDRRRRREELAKRLESSAAQLHTFAKGAAELRNEVTSAAVQRHVLRTVGSEAVDLLLQYEELQADEVEVMQDGTPCLPLSAARRKAIIAVLPPDLSSSASEMVDALNAATIAELQTALDAAAEAAGLRLKKLDKKAERAGVAEFQKHQRRQLRDATDPAEALALAVPLLFSQAKGKLISVPGKAITGVLTELEGDVGPEAFQLVTGFHQDVVAYIRAKSQENEESGLLEALLARMPALRVTCCVESE